MKRRANAPTAPATGSRMPLNENVLPQCAGDASVANSTAASKKRMAKCPVASCGHLRSSSYLQLTLNEASSG